MMTQHTIDPKAARQAWLAIQPAQNGQWYKLNAQRKEDPLQEYKAEAERGMDEGSLVGHGVGMLNAMDGSAH